MTEVMFSTECLDDNRVIHRTFSNTLFSMVMFGSTRGFPLDRLRVSSPLLTEPDNKIEIRQKVLPLNRLQTMYLDKSDIDMLRS